MTTQNPYASPDSDQSQQKPASRPPKHDREPWPVWATHDTVFPRHLAAVIDNLAAAVLSVIAAKQLSDDWILAQVAAMVVAYLGYFFLFEGLFARTPGRLWTGLVVVDLQGRRCSWGQTAVRTLWRLVEMNPLVLGHVIAALCIVSSSSHQRFGDRFAKTLVIPRRRMPKPSLPAAATSSSA